MLQLHQRLHASTRLRPGVDTQHLCSRSSGRCHRVAAGWKAWASPCAQAAPPAASQRSVVVAAAAVDTAQDAAQLQGILQYKPGNASSRLEARAIGCMIGAMCGNALGAPVQNDRHWQITRLHPYGLTEIPVIDLGQKPVPRGGVTGEYEQLLAMAHSLVAAATCDAAHQAAQMAEYCDPDARRYTPYAELLLQALRTGSAPVAALPRLAREYLASSEALATSTASDRPEREPFGPADFGAAVRMPPLVIAYRDAPLQLLEAAVEEACLMSHSHPLGVDGARVVAAAIQWLMGGSCGTAQGEGQAATPEQLLSYLQGVARTQDMQARLKMLQGNLFQLGAVTNWAQLYKSKSWHNLVQVHSKLTLHDHATVGTEAAAVALWALCTSWEHPRQAVTVAATLGGSAPVTAQLVGAMAGALHGDGWIPASWWDLLENNFAPPAPKKQTGLSSRLGSISVASQSSVAESDNEQEDDLSSSTAVKGTRDEALVLTHQLLALAPSGVGLSQEQWDELHRRLQSDEDA